MEKNHHGLISVVEYPKAQYLDQFYSPYINDIDTGVKCKVSKFADDTKLGYPCKTKEDCNIIQQDLDKIVEWS